jgi:cyclophilin family peptidyl-prolyl cis-trans isomerase
MAQIGINKDPEVSKQWRGKIINDDPVIQSNTRGTISFAHSGKNSRSTQIFFNVVDNKYLDKEGFTPFGSVESGMEFIDALYNKYGEGWEKKLFYVYICLKYIVHCIKEQHL